MCVTVLWQPRYGFVGEILPVACSDNPTVQLSTDKSTVCPRLFSQPLTVKFKLLVGNCFKKNTLHNSGKTDIEEKTGLEESKELQS